ncbi:MAG: PadR family transcriptional regulator [Candidatus Dormibacteraeota bacterium]|nr:PadR family transcriptional regulator [Candidatus Dormibacteraeota bacterium]
MATFPKSRLDLVSLTVLGLLAERPCHPYEMQRMIRERHKEFAQGPPRALYHAAARLERDGYIAVSETSREGKRPERTVYAITEEGREEFTHWVRDLLSTPMVEHSVFSAAVSFIAGLTTVEAAASLEARVVSLEGSIAGSEAAHRVLIEQVGLSRLYIVEQELNRQLMRAELDWTRELIADIRLGELRWEPRVELPLTGGVERVHVRGRLRRVT